MISIRYELSVIVPKQAMSFLSDFRFAVFSNSESLTSSFTSNIVPAILFFSNPKIWFKINNKTWNYIQLYFFLLYSRTRLKALWQRNYFSSDKGKANNTIIPLKCPKTRSSHFVMLYQKFRHFYSLVESFLEETRNRWACVRVLSHKSWQNAGWNKGYASIFCSYFYDSYCH